MNDTKSVKSNVDYSIDNCVQESSVKTTGRVSMSGYDLLLGEAAEEDYNSNAKNFDPIKLTVNGLKNIWVGTFKQGAFWGSAYSDRVAESEIARLTSMCEERGRALLSEIEKKEILLGAVKWYANSNHIQDLRGDLENPSGEPENWLCDSDDKFNLENGGVARAALSKLGEK